MSAEANNPDSCIYAMLPTDTAVTYCACISFNGPAQRAITEFIARHIRPVRYNNAFVAEPLRKRYASKDKIELGDDASMEYSHFSIDAVTDIEASKEFTKILLDIYENALSLEIATVLDTGASVKNPEMLQRIRTLGEQLVVTARELAGDNNILLLGIHNLLNGCSCIIETHKVMLSAVEECAGDPIVSVYVSLAERLARFYAVGQNEAEA